MSDLEDLFFFCGHMFEMSTRAALVTQWSVLGESIFFLARHTHTRANLHRIQLTYQHVFGAWVETGVLGENPCKLHAYSDLGGNPIANH